MPRAPRINVPGVVYHVINRGVKQLAIFHDDEDRLEFFAPLCQTPGVTAGNGWCF